MLSPHLGCELGLKSHKCEATLDYVVSFQLVWAVEWELVSYKQNKQGSIFKLQSEERSLSGQKLYLLSLKA